MGACSSSSGRITYTYNDIKKSYKTVPSSYSQLRKSIKSEIKLKDFDIFIDNENIDSEEAYKKYLNSRTHLVVQIREKQSTKAQTPKEEEKIYKYSDDPKVLPNSKSQVQFKIDEPKVSTKQKSIKKNFARNVPKRLESYVYSVFSEIFSIEIQTLIVGVGYICIDKYAISDPWSALMYRDNKSKETGRLKYINTFGSFLYYELEDFHGKLMPEKYFFGQDLEFHSEINEVPYEFTRNREQLDKFTVNSSTKALEIGQAITTGDKFVGIISEILDNKTLTILQPSFLYQFTESITKSHPLLEIPNSIKNFEEISKLTGKVTTNNGEFITLWTLINPDYIVIPTHKLPQEHNELVIELKKGKKTKLVKMNKGKLSHTEHLQHFEVFQFTHPQVKSLPAEYSSEPKSKAKLINGDGQEISLTKQKNSSEQTLVFTTDKPIECGFHGSLVSSHSKIFGIVNSVQGYTVQVSLFSDFQRIELKNSVKTGKKTYPVIPATSIKFENPPKYSRSSSEQEEEPEESSSEKPEEFSVSRSRNFQEAGIEEGNIEIGGEFEVNFDFPEAKPENYSFVVAGDNILKYNSDQYSPVVVGKAPKVRKGASFLTTPHGLVIVYDSLAMLIMEDTENLPLLLSSHLFHASVWHNGLVFVVSGEGNSSVETLEIGQDMWKRVENLPDPRSNAAIVSAGDFVYLMGGKVNGNADKSILRFKEKWETIEYSLPFPLMNMSVIFSENKFVVFGGSTGKAVNDMYYLLDANCKHSATGELPVKGDFRDKSIGVMNDVYSILLNQDEVIEYSSGFFKMVKMG